MKDFECKNISNILSDNVFYLFSVAKFLSFDNIFYESFDLIEKGFDPDDFFVLFLLILMGQVLFVFGLCEEVLIKII